MGILLLGRRIYRIDPAYFATAEKRIQAELDRHPMFEKPTPIRQSTLFAEATA